MISLEATDTGPVFIGNRFNVTDSTIRQYINVVRTELRIKNNVVRLLRPLLSSNIGGLRFASLSDSVEGYLAREAAAGVIAGGTVVADARNTPSAFTSGDVYVTVEVMYFTPVERFHVREGPEVLTTTISLTG